MSYMTTEAWKSVVFKVGDKLHLNDESATSRQILLESISHLTNKFKTHHLTAPIIDATKKNNDELKTFYVDALMKYCHKIDDKDTFRYLSRLIEAHPLLQEGDRILLSSLLFGRPPTTFRSVWSRLNPYVDGLTIAENIMIINTFLSIIYKFKKPSVIKEALTFIRNYIQANVLNMPGKNLTEKLKLFFEYSKCLYEFTKIVPKTNVEHTLVFFIDVGLPANKLPWLDKIDPATWIEKYGKTSSSSQYILDPRTQYVLNKLSYTYAPFQEQIDKTVLQAFRIKFFNDSPFADNLLKKICEQMTYTYAFATTSENTKDFVVPRDYMFKVSVKFQSGSTLLPLTLHDGRKVFLIPPGYKYTIDSVKKNDALISATEDKKALPVLVDFLHTKS